MFASGCLHHRFGGTLATRRHVGRYAIAVTVIAAALAAPARAATVTTINACLYSVENEYRDQAVTLTGSGSPIGAPAGGVATLSGASLSARLPPSLPRTGYELGIFKAGYNAIPAKVWIALAATNATPATQVRALTVTASTTIRVNAGRGFVSGTPIVVTIPIPNTTWTLLADGPVSFSQAGPGTLPPLPVGVGDRLAPVTGSIVVKPKLASLRFVLDCQPGFTAPPYTTITPALATPFGSLDAAVPVPPSALRLRVASPALKHRAGRVGVAIACPPGAFSCMGRASVRSLANVRVGSAGRVLTIAGPSTYTVAAGARRTVGLALTPIARRVLRARRSLRVRVGLDPADGADVTRILTLTR